jgi:hypothetical protein
LFAHFRAQVILYLETGLDRDAFSRHAHASLLTDLINERLDEATILDRNRYARLPLEGDFRLIKLTRRGTAPHSLYDYLESRLSNALPHAKVFSLRDDVLILTSDTQTITSEAKIAANDAMTAIGNAKTVTSVTKTAANKAGAAVNEAKTATDAVSETGATVNNAPTAANETASAANGAKSSVNDERNSRLHRIIVENDLLCGISEPFTHLRGIRHAFTQASAAIRLGQRIGTNQTLKKLGIANKTYDTRYFVYADYYSYHHIEGPHREHGSENPGLFSATGHASATGLSLAAGPSLTTATAPAPEEFLPPVFLRLLAGDSAAGTDNLHVLYAYLRNDCNKTHTAEALFMHRNNINYRIRRIEDTLGAAIQKDPLKTTLTIAFLSLELIAPECLDAI